MHYFIIALSIFGPLHQAFGRTGTGFYESIIMNHFMKKQKLLVFHHNLAPYRLDFWNRLNDLFELQVFFMYENVLNQKFDQHTLKMQLNFDCQYHTKGLNIGNRAFRWRYLPIIKRIVPDIVISYEYSQTTCALYMIKKLFGFKYKLYTICDDSLDISVHSSGVRKIFRDYLATRLDGLILVDRKAAEWYEKTFNITNKTIVFPILSEESRFRRNLAAALNRSNELIETNSLTGKKCIFYVGRLAQEKGIDRLMLAFSKIHHPFPEAMLVLVGDGDRREQLVKLSETLLIHDKVLFAGRSEGENLYAWFNLAPVLVLPSHYEPFGAVVNELLLSGADALCSNLAGAATLVDANINGQTFDPYDVKTLGEMLEEQLRKISPLTKMFSVRASKMLISFDNSVNHLYKILSDDEKSYT